MRIVELLFPAKSEAASPRMPNPLLAMFSITIVTFYASNSFRSPLTDFLFTAKWAPFAGLLVMSLAMLSGRRRPDVPVAMLVPLGALLVIATITGWTGIDRQTSLLAVASVAATILCGYALSALIVATDSRRAFFELLANFGRAIIALSAILLVLRLNFGRGAGFSGWSDNPNTLAALLAPSLVIFMAGCIERREGWRLKHALFLVVGLYVVAATDARATAAWLLFSAAAFWVYRRGAVTNLVMLLLTLIFLLIWWQPISNFLVDTLDLARVRPQGRISALSGREEVWRIGWRLFTERPLLGYGLGTSQDLLRLESWRFVQHQGHHFHSSYIMALVETGLPGMLAMVSAFLVTLARGVTDANRRRLLPKEQWPLGALPFALVIGCMAHALFESWLIAAGNANTLIFWTWVWMIHHQAQIQLRPVARVGSAPALDRRATLPAQ